MKAISMNQLALGMIRRQKRQYLTLALGIFLAVYFAATMLLLGSSISQTFQKMHNDRKGNQDYVFFNIGDAPLNELVETGLVTEYGVTEIIAEVEPRPKTNFSAFSLARFDQKALDITGKRLIAGRMPEQAGEIALEQETLSLQRITAKPGERIQLKLHIPDGSDYLAKPVTKEYLLTGILADQRLHLLQEVYESHFAYLDYPAGIVSSAEMIEAGGKAIRTAYIKLAPNVDEADPRILDFTQKHGIRMQWTGFGGLSENFSGDPNTPTDIKYSLGFAVFVTLILLLAACLGIVNAFSSNLQQRKQQIGLLRAVGATKRQIRQLFGREVLLLSILMIPLALALGCLTVWGMTRLLGPTYFFYPQLGILAVVAVFSVCSVWLSVRIPLRRAAQIPPMQAIRDSDLSRRMKTRKIKSRSRFQVPRLLAARNLKLYSNRLLGITIFIILSLFLVMVVPFFLEGQLQNTLMHYQVDYEISKAVSLEEFVNKQYHIGGLNDGDVAEAASLPDVESLAASKRLALNLIVDQAADYFTLAGYSMTNTYLIENSDHIPFARRPREYENYQLIKEKYSYSKELLQSSIRAIEAQALEHLQPYVYEGSIRPDRIAAGEEIILVAPPAIQVLLSDGGGKIDISALADPALSGSQKPNERIMVFENDQFHAGDEMTLSLLYSDSPVKRDESGSIIPTEDAVRIDKKVTIGALLRPVKFDSGTEFLPLTRHDSDTAIAPLTSIEGLAAMGFEAPFTELNIQLKEKPDPDLEAYLTDQLDMIANRSDGYRMTSWLGLAEKSRWAYRIFLLSAVAIIILFFALIASMVSNNLTARIRAGRREIGTIRAVGASGPDILRSYDLQLLALFGAGAVLGYAAGWALCYWISLGPNVPWPALPIWQPILFIVSLFLICRLNIWLKIRQILKRSIVENIREL